MHLSWRTIDKSDMTLADFKDRNDVYALTAEDQVCGAYVDLSDVAKSPNSGDDLAAMPGEEVLTWSAGRAAIEERRVKPLVKKIVATHSGVESGGSVDPTAPFPGGEGYGISSPSWGGHTVIIGGMPFIYARVVGGHDYEIPLFEWARAKCPMEKFERGVPPSTAYRVRVGEHSVKYHAFEQEFTMKVTIPDLSDDGRYQHRYYKDDSDVLWFWSPVWREDRWPPGTMISALPTAVGVNRTPYTEDEPGKYHGQIGDIKYYIDAVSVWIPDDPWDKPGWGGWGA
ncbi:MAG: hypothetical protein IJR14_08190 [Synergistaceae bacterium]|nr:hypothetical protein [Synergistaceae bacterium]